MANKNFVVKNGLTVNTNFVVNSTSFSYANTIDYSSNNLSFTPSGNLSVTVGNNASITVSNNVTLNFPNLYIGSTNLTITSVAANLNFNTLNITSTTFTTNSTALTIKAGLIANNSLGSSGQILASNGSIAYWVTPATIPAAVAISDNTSSSSTFYFPMSGNTSGVWSNAIVSSTKLYFVPSSGTLSATILNTLSDETLKSNVHVIENPLDIVNQIDGVSFNWKDNGLPSFGVIAQQVEKALPELVTTGQNDTKTVNYNGLIAVLLEAIKVLEKKIEKLEMEK